MYQRRIGQLHPWMHTNDRHQNVCSGSYANLAMRPTKPLSSTSQDYDPNKFPQSQWHVHHKISQILGRVRRFVRLRKKIKL